MSKNLWEVLMAKGYDPLHPPAYDEIVAAMERAPPMIEEVLQDVLDRHYQTRGEAKTLTEVVRSLAFEETP